MSRLLVVSNRLPVSASRRAGKISFRTSTGGLATGLSSVSQSYQSFWIGWPGMPTEQLIPAEQEHIREQLATKNCHPVFLAQEDIDRYYHGFCNETIWPLFHYFPLHATYEESYWQSYRQINEAFADVVVKHAQPNDCIWVHDYQLMLLPQLIRQRIPNASIGFFLHIPFPSFELFRLLPWREELIQGLLGADLVGFHTYDYVRHFLSSACRICGLDHHTLGKLTVDNRIVKVDAFPMGIDYQRYSQASQKKKVQNEITTIRKRVGDRKIIISIDRLDYTKGIIQRLQAFDLFLSQNPQYKDKVVLILLAVPSRESVEDYIDLREHLEALVGRVNGEHATIGQMPVWYIYRAVPFERLVALYNLADVALITPLRDGMNLIAKEFIAARTTGTGVLILSEMAGAARELGEAIIVNANDKASIVAAIKEALEMPQSEQVKRNSQMQKRLSRYTVYRWAGDFLDSLADIKKIQQSLSIRKLSESHQAKLTADYAKSRKRLLMLDYDGTLRGFVAQPEQAIPDNELLELLEQLTADPSNNLVVVSGRHKTILSQWLGHLDCTLIAEHGGWIKHKGQDWTAAEPLRNDWKDAVRPLLELYVDRTPGSFIEEKDFSLVWHCRKTEPALAYVRTQELRDAVLSLIENLDVGVYEGSEILEIKTIGINKGRAAKACLGGQKWDFVLAAGDDYTDEDMFAALPRKAYSIKVGYRLSKARYNVHAAYELRSLLKQLAGSQHA